MKRTRDEKFETIPMQESDENEWPDHVRSLGIDELANLGIDKNGSVYWCGKEIQIRKKLALTFWQKIGATTIALSAVAASIATVFGFYLSFELSGCEFKLFAFTCGSSQ